MTAKILWFTGLSGSGKTTISNEVKNYLEYEQNKVLILDGDDVRKRFHSHLGFTPEDILENNRLICEICLNEKEKYDFIIVPIISPFRESRVKARSLLGSNFIEVFLSCSIEECRKRDVKGLYKQALAGEIENFIGISKNTPYESPDNPEIILNTETETVQESLKKILSFLGF